MLCARCSATLRPYSGMLESASGHGIERTQLTKAEQMVFLMLSNGLSNKQIADQLTISQNTVRYHLKQVYLKLGVRSRTHAVAVGSQLHGGEHRQVDVSKVSDSPMPL